MTHAPSVGTRNPEPLDDDPSLDALVGLDELVGLDVLDVLDVPPSSAPELASPELPPVDPAPVDDGFRGPHPTATAMHTPQTDHLMALTLPTDRPPWCAELA